MGKVCKKTLFDSNAVAATDGKLLTLLEHNRVMVKPADIGEIIVCFRTSRDGF